MVWSLQTPKSLGGAGLGAAQVGEEAKQGGLGHFWALFM